MTSKGILKKFIVGLILCGMSIGLFSTAAMAWTGTYMSLNGSTSASNNVYSAYATVKNISSTNRYALVTIHLNNGGAVSASSGSISPSVCISTNVGNISSRNSIQAKGTIYQTGSSSSKVVESRTLSLK